MKYVVCSFSPIDLYATYVIVAQLDGYHQRTILGDMLKIDNKEYEQAIKDYNGVPYTINNFATFVEVADAQKFINEYLIPKTVTARLRGVKY